MLYGDGAGDEGEDDSATFIQPSSGLKHNNNNGSFVGTMHQQTNRTYASATMKSALNGSEGKCTGSAALTMKTINKSLAKLDFISQMNWSKKDQNLEVLS